MKKIITLITFLTYIIGNAQCPAPSNLTLSIPYPTAAQLSWTENGAATTWEIAVIPDFYVGVPLPSDVWAPASTNPFLLTNLPPAYGCYAFFVRSACSLTDVSPWVAVGSLGCSTNVYNHLATLSNDSFSLNTDNSDVQIFPNPSKNVVRIKSNSKIEKIAIFDSLGKVILIQTQNNNEIDVETLSKGIYLIEVITENEKIHRKFIKE